ncbi:hypothetical protein [Acidovorax sp.]|uniref:hypothetical protein n=1 Tax=Acidovorax sp. TaxID=1872122 RepID=UPI000A877ED9|nr:hypothetical protein [Acidovorax sp.]
MLMSAVASSFFFAPVRALAPEQGAAVAAKAKMPAASPVASAFQSADTAPDPADADCHTRHTHTNTYWPCELLNDFVLRMAAQGHCVNMSMMLGHRPYALERLALAAQGPDASLQELAGQLRPYFDAPVLEAGAVSSGH